MAYDKKETDGILWGTFKARKQNLSYKAGNQWKGNQNTNFPKVQRLL